MKTLGCPWTFWGNLGAIRLGQLSGVGEGEAVPSKQQGSCCQGPESDRWAWPRRAEKSPWEAEGGAPASGSSPRGWPRCRRVEGGPGRHSTLCGLSWRACQSPGGPATWGVYVGLNLQESASRAAVLSHQAQQACLGVGPGPVLARPRPCPGALPPRFQAISRPQLRPLPPRLP